MADSSRTIRLKLDADAKGIIAATKTAEREVDRFSNSVDKKFRRSGDTSGKGFLSGLKKWFSPAALGDLKKSGEFGGTAFGSGLLGVLKTPVLGPALVGVVGATVATVMPAVGAVAGTGLVAGFGLGLAGLGVTFAAKSDKVKAEWKKTLDGMGSDMRLLSQPFESTLTHLAGTASKTFATFKPELDKAFKVLAPTLTTFGDEAAGAFTELSTAIGPLADASSTVLRTLGPAFQTALRDTSKGLVNLASSVKSNPNGLADLTRGIGGVTKTLFDGIAVLNTVNGQIDRLTGGFSGVDFVMGAVKVTLSGIFGPFELLSKAMDAVGIKAKTMNDQVKITADTAKLWTQGLTQAQLAAMGITGVLPDTAGKVEALSTKLDRQKAATDALIQSTFRLQNLALGLAGAEINYQSAVDAATASIKENGRTTDINTEKGRANKTALLGVAQAANAQTQSLVESNAGLGAATRSAEASKTSFVRLATQMGLSRREAVALADKLIGIPKDTKAKVSAPGASTAKGDVDALGRSLGNLPKTTTVNIYRNMIETTIDRGLVASGKGVPRASGGLMQPGRTYLLGERGPEPVVMGRNGGARAISAESAPRELASGNQPIVVENHIEIGGEVVRVVRTEIKANDRDTTRRVTAGVRR